MFFNLSSVRRKLVVSACFLYERMSDTARVARVTWENVRGAECSVRVPDLKTGFAGGSVGLFYLTGVYSEHRG